MSPESECVVTGSTLSLTSAARGAAHLALETVFRDPVNVGRPQAKRTRLDLWVIRPNNSGTEQTGVRPR